MAHKFEVHWTAIDKYLLKLAQWRNIWYTDSWIEY